jgi:hypothetical protein
MDTKEINNKLEEQKKDLIASGSKDLSDYALGFIHGLEYALAMHAKRPVLYVNKDRTYNMHDKHKFPEYFL